VPRVSRGEPGLGFAIAAAQAVSSVSGTPDQQLPANPHDDRGAAIERLADAEQEFRGQGIPGTVYLIHFREFRGQYT
jgi:hypothetical protein